MLNILLKINKYQYLKGVTRSRSAGILFCSIIPYEIWKGNSYSCRLKLVLTLFLSLYATRQVNSVYAGLALKSFSFFLKLLYYLDTFRLVGWFNKLSPALSCKLVDYIYEWFYVLFCSLHVGGWRRGTTRTTRMVPQEYQMMLIHVILNLMWCLLRSRKQKPLVQGDIARIIRILNLRWHIYVYYYSYFRLEAEHCYTDSTWLTSAKHVAAWQKLDTNLQTMTLSVSKRWLPFHARLWHP